MSKKDIIYIFGHRNPDTDSICASLAYENLKHKLGYDNYIAAKLGDVNKETRYALNYFDIDEPILIDTLKPQVSDLDLKQIEPLHSYDHLKKALGLIIKQKGNVSPIVNDNNKLIGIVAISDIAPAYMGLAGKSLLKVTKTPFKNIVDVLDGTVLNELENEDDCIVGDIYTISDITGDRELESDDIIISDTSEESQKKVYSSKAGYIIFADNVQKDLINIPNNSNKMIIGVQYSTFEIIKLISQTIPIKTMVKKNMLEYYQLDDYLDEVKDTMLTSKHRRFPVTDNDGYVKGMISKSDFLNINRKKVVLVDHNEKNQSANGIEEADIIEIIDHHRVANIQTMFPLTFRAEPLGSSCTIIGKMYKEYNIEIDQKMAGIMLSAIISDTLLFNSPTCTDEDKKMALYLAAIAGVNVEKYGMEMIIAGTSLEGETAKSIVCRDMKRFTFGRYKASISQINTGDFAGLYSLHEQVIKEMEDLCEIEDLDMAILMITDIVIGGTEILAVGKERWIAENAFRIRKGRKSVFLPKVFSRKKQVVPVLMNAAKL